MLDPPQPLLLFEVVDNAPLGIQIDLHGLLVNIMQQIEIKITHTALTQLVFENLCRIIALAADLVTGIFGGKIVAVPGIFGQRPANDPF